MNRSKLIADRRDKDAFFRNHQHSPLTPAQRQTFSGLSYYPENKKLVIDVTVERFAEQQQILMQTNRDELRPFFKHGTFEVEVEGKAATLTVYRSPDGHYFLPFVDANAGTETYPAGRYLDLHTDDGMTFHVDFNLAYNPYCAYNNMFICPMTPPDNRIDIPIRAGEKLPEGDWVEK
jgi:uncharacterized protein (DUF1684 family)